MSQEEKKEKIDNVANDTKNREVNQRIQIILQKAKEKGKITYGELATELGDANVDQIDKVFDAFEKIGVDVLRDDDIGEPDIEDLEQVEDIKIEDIQ